MAKKDEEKKEEQVVVPPVQLALLKAQLKEELREEIAQELIDNPDNEVLLTTDELATEIVAVMSKELHLRVGIGPIWRQLNPTRKSEIMEKWTADVVLILEESR
jgi:hypothetical protein